MSTKRYVEIKNKFIDGAIKVVAESGFDKASTRTVAEACDLNDSLIFRYFDNKEAMFRQSFARTDREIFQTIWTKAGQLANQKELSVEQSMRQLLDTTWIYLMTNKEKSLFYVRYYYSAHYKERDKAEHIRLYKPLIEGLTSIMEEGTMVDVVLHAIFDMLMNLVVKGLKGELPHDGSEFPKNFRLIYSILKEYLARK